MQNTPTYHRPPFQLHTPIYLKQHTGPLVVSRESGAPADQVEETPGRASLEKLGCRTPPQLHAGVPTTPACAWWNRPEEDNSSGKLESTHPSRTSVKSDQGLLVSSRSCVSTLTHYSSELLLPRHQGL